MAGQSVHRYSTYAWLPNNDSIENPVYNDRTVQQSIITEVNERMAREGYRLNRRRPDLLVRVHTMFDEQEDVIREPVYASYAYYFPPFYLSPYYSNYYYFNYTTVPRIVGYDVETVTYTVGTIVIDLIDAKTSKLVWRGTAEGTIEPLDVEDEVADYVDAIYNKFPEM